MSNTPLSSHQSRKYSIVKYDPEWKQTFLNEEKILREIFGELARAIEHVGSTAVEGLAGKPTVDVLVTVDDVPAIDDLNATMESAGYHALGEYVLPGARLFVREQDQVRLVNVHVFQKDHAHVREMLQLRDYLRLHPQIVKEYSDLKLSLIEKYPTDYASYRKEKDVYMQELMKKVGEHSL